jgi:predicted Zn-dependent protease
MASFCVACSSRVAWMRPLGAALVSALLAIHIADAQPVPAQNAPAQSVPAASLPAAAQVPADFPEVKLAREAFQRGDVEAARKALLTLVEQHAEFAPADVYMAYLFISAGRWAEADLSLDRAMTIAPDDPEAFLLLAETALREHRRSYAAIAFERAEGLLKKYDKNPQRLKVLNARLHAGSSTIAEARGQYDAAAEHLQAWMALSPKDPIPLGMLGRIRFLQKNYEQARACFRQLSEKSKDAPPAELALGRLYSDAGMTEEARKCMETAVKESGQDIRTRLAVAEWALTTGLADVAEENLREALTLDKTSVAAGLLAARLARQNGDLAKAESTLRDLVLREPNQVLLSNELARTLAATAEAEKWKSGLEYARRNFELQQRSDSDLALEVILTYALLLHRNGRGAEAEAALNLLPGGRTISSEDTYIVARIYAENGKRAAAAAAALRVALSGRSAFPGRKDAEVLLKKLQAETVEQR